MAALAFLAAPVVLAAPASAADVQRPLLSRAISQSDPFAEAMGARVVMALDVKNAGRWEDVLQRQAAAMSQPCADNSPGHCFSTFWIQTVAELKNLTRADQVRMVDAIVNRMGYWSDQDLYRKADYWATPEEMFEKLGGDCEDFALFKYFLLRAAGVPADDLRLTLVASNDQPHMVTLVMVDGTPVMLDCVVLDAAPPAGMRRYQAVYTMSETGAWFLAADEPTGAQIASADLNR